MAHADILAHPAGRSDAGGAEFSFGKVFRETTSLNPAMHCVDICK
jgi:hypothetical protein